jgi:type VI secretion system protein ImpA
MQEWPEGFDLAALVAPIPGEMPAGQDLREDKSPEALYFRLRDARREASAAERAADAPKDDSDPRPVDSAPVPPILQWRIVRELATEALSLHSKDLEIAAWLTEALLRDAGLSGLTAGFRLLAELAENFWDDLFPRPDEEGIATRVAPVAALNGVGREGTLIQPLRKIVLYERPQDSSPLYFWQYELSADIAGSGSADQRQERYEARGLPPFEAIENEAPLVYARLAELRRDIRAAAEAWQELGRVFDERAGADGPPTSGIRDVLENIRFAADRLAAPDQNVAEADTPAAGTSAPSTSPGKTDGAGSGAPAATGLASREEALRALAQIADYFRRTEPLSPISYTLQEAVRRGRMTWPELLEEIVPDPMSRSAILSNLGIRPPPSE